MAIANPLKKDLRWKTIREYCEERGHAAGLVKVSWTEK